jgi:tRNA dimethylallyltransferase
MKVLTIVGPTAVGKTHSAIAIAQRISGEIISADSRQIYRALNIGTAKPTAEEQELVTFHLIDFVPPDSSYSCGQFARDADQKIKEISARGNTPIVCGGTGLYIRALFHPLHKLPESNKDIKAKLMGEYKKHGIEHLYARLLKVDPEWAQKITPRDKQRILRGLEVYAIRGKPLSSFTKAKRKKSRYLPYYVGLTLTRDVLYDRINRRFDSMVEQGLVEEVKALLDQGLDPASSALRTIGYKEIIEHLSGALTFDEAIEKAKRRTRNFAKRQIAWFKNIEGIHWFTATEPDIVNRIIAAFRRQTNPKL